MLAFLRKCPIFARYLYPQIRNPILMKNILTKSLPLVAMFVVASIPLFAQNCNPNIPIDGGLSALLIAGAGYGVKKLANKNKEK